MWISQASTTDLQNNAIHIWSIRISDYSDRIKQLWKTLSRIEQARAITFKFEKDRTRYIVSHAVLRKLLASYLKIKVNEFNYSTNDQSKPYLKDYTIDFNLSHSNNIALIVFVKDRPVGVDVEYLNQSLKYEDLVNQVFTQNEKNQLNQIPSAQKRAAFLQGWTSKEAFIKAKGKGLSFPLKEFEVSLTPGLFKLEKTIYKPSEIHLWYIHGIYPATNYVGAFATTKPNMKPEFLSYSEK